VTESHDVDLPASRTHGLDGGEPEPDLSAAGAAPDPPAAAPPDDEASGVPGSHRDERVEAAVADTDQARLEQVPVDQHPAAFERAHEALRGALDDDPATPSQPARSSPSDGA